MSRISFGRWRSLARDLTAGTFGGRNFLSLGGGQVVLGFAQWGTLSALALLGGAKEVGELAFALAIVTPVYQLVKMKLRDVLATDVAYRWPVSDYLRVTNTACWVGMGMSLAIALLLAGPALLVVVAGVAGSRFFEALSQISYGYEQRRDQMVRIGWSLTARGLVSVSLVFVSFWWTRDVDLAAIALAVGNGLVYFFYDRPARSNADSQWSAQTKSSPGRFQLVKMALPLGFISALSAVTDSVPRLVVEDNFGLAELGVLASFGYVVVGASYLTRAIGQASGSRVAVVMASDNKNLFVKQVWRLLGISVAAGGALILGAYLFGEQFLNIAFGPEFAAFSDDFVLVTVYASFEFIVTPLSLVLIAARKFRIQLAIEALSTLSAIVASLVLIPDLGITGAAFALIIAGFVRAALSGLESYRVIRQL